MEEIDIKELFNYVKEKVWIVLVAIILSINITLIYTKVIKKPIYKSSTTYVLTSSSEQQGITTSEVKLNEEMIATYKEIIRSNTVLGKVAEKLELINDTTNINSVLSKLRKSVSVEQVSTSSLIIQSTLQTTQLVSLSTKSEPVLQSSLILRLSHSSFLFSLE